MYVYYINIEKSIETKKQQYVFKRLSVLLVSSDVIEGVGKSVADFIPEMKNYDFHNT